MILITAQCQITQRISHKRKKTVLDELKALSAVSRIEKMEANLSKDTFVFNEMALDGQISLF
jgi:hypothetical protein